MKYLDILKQFDKAIVTESQKLQDIYDNICKGETPNNQVCNEDETEEKKEIKDKEGCPDCGNDLDKCTCGKEEKKEVTENSDEADKKQMCEFSEGEKKDTEDGKMLSAEKFFAGVDKEGDAEEEKTADDSEKKDEEPIEKKEEKQADAEEAKKEEVPAEEKKDEEE